MNRNKAVPADYDRYIHRCNLEGELSKRSEHDISLDKLFYRAAFLLDVKHYAYFYERSNFSDLWWGLATGVPEIQISTLAKAAAESEEIGHFLFENASERQLTRVEWTPTIVKIVEKFLVPPPTAIRHFDNALFGYLGLNGSVLLQRILASFQYFKGHCLRQLKGEELVESCPELEQKFRELYGCRISDILEAVDPNRLEIEALLKALIAGGYTHPVKRFIWTGHAGPPGNGINYYIADNAIATVRISLLKAVLREWPAGAAVSASSAAANLDRARLALEQHGSDLPASVIEMYRVALGEAVPGNPEAYTYAVPDPFQAQLPNVNVGLELSDAVLYDSRSTMMAYPDSGENIHLLAADAFRLGSGFTFSHEGSFSSYRKYAMFGKYIVALSKQERVELNAAFGSIVNGDDPEVSKKIDEKIEEIIRRRLEAIRKFKEQILASLH